MTTPVTDDWRIEAQTLLIVTEIYKELKRKCNTDPAGRQIIQLIDDAVYYAYERTKIIVKNMGELAIPEGLTTSFRKMQ